MNLRLEHEGVHLMQNSKRFKKNFKQFFENHLVKIKFNLWSSNLINQVLTYFSGSSSACSSLSFGESSSDNSVSSLMAPIVSKFSENLKK